MIILRFNFVPTLKKFIQISLVFLYLLVSVDVPAVAHFCNDRLVSFEFCESDGCCSENETKPETSLDPDCCYSVNLKAPQEGNSEIANKSFDLKYSITSDLKSFSNNFKFPVLKSERVQILDNHFLKWLVPKKLFILFSRLILHH